MITKHNNWPRTVGEAVNKLSTYLSDSTKADVKNTPADNLWLFHFSIGQYIRNEFGLFGGNEDLLKSCGSESMSADDASMEIIKALWERLQVSQ